MGVQISSIEVPDAFDGFGATLIFGVGARDEGIDQLGLTHLAEQVILAAVTTEVDDMSSVIETTFTATGTPGEVAEYLRAICAAIADPPLDNLPDIARDAYPGDRFLDLDVGDATRDPWGSLLARRCGPTGLGLSRWPAVAYPEFSAQEIRGHVARYFTADNALLAASAPIELALPAGPRPSHPWSPLQVSTPSWYADEVVAPGLAVRAEAGPAAPAVGLLLMHRIHAALGAAGQDYWVSPWSTPVADGALDLGVSLIVGQSRRRDPAAAAAILWRELVRIATEAAAADEISELVGPYLDGRRDASIEGKRALLGVSDEFARADYEAAARLAPDDVRAAAASWLRTATVVVPAGVEIAAPELTRVVCPMSTFVPEGDVFKPSLAKRLRGGSGYLVRTDDGLHLVEAESVHAFPLADLIVVQRPREILLGNVRHGCLVDVSHFSGVERLKGWVPARRWRTTMD